MNFFFRRYNIKSINFKITNMAEQKSTPAKKHKSPIFWVLITCGGCLALLLCITSVITLLCLTSDTFKESFTESYCDQLKEKGMSLSEDPLGICK